MEAGLLWSGTRNREVRYTYAYGCQMCGVHSDWRLTLTKMSKACGGWLLVSWMSFWQVRDGRGEGTEGRRGKVIGIYNKGYHCHLLHPNTTFAVFVIRKSARGPEVNVCAMHVKHHLQNEIQRDDHAVRNCYDQYMKIQTRRRRLTEHAKGIEKIERILDSWF